jgi:hypothetical protein
MKIEIKYLPCYRWKGYSIGIRIIIQKKIYSIVIPIPQWFFDCLIYIRGERNEIK